MKPISDVRVVETKESAFVKPFSLLFKQVCYLCYNYFGSNAFYPYISLIFFYQSSIKKYASNVLFC